MMHTKQYWDLL